MKQIFMFILVAIMFVGCKEDEVVPIAKLSVDELEVKASYTTADITWKIQSEAAIDAVVIEYSSDSTLETYKEMKMQQIDKEPNYYTISLDSLSNGISYYFRCRAINKINSSISKVETFSTIAYQLADIRTDTITDIDVSSAKLHASLINCGADENPIIGFYVATHQGISEKDSCILVDAEIIKDSLSFSYLLSDLEDNVTYYVRAFAKNIKGISWGKELSFTTTEMLLPSVGATILKYVSYTNAICSSEIISDGGGTILERGFCYATTDNPTFDSNKKVNEGEDKLYNSYISELKASTTYYVRAYAINPKGVTYGDQLEFTTKAYSLPVVTTSNVTNIKYTSVVCGGEVTDDGGQMISERGVCFSTSQTPTISDNIIISGNGIGTFSCNISNLNEGITYYVRAYATNAVGTSYGDIVEFTTKEHLPNAIYYTASQKLTETADNSQPGLHIYRFNTTIANHSFEDGEGVIVFDGVLTNIGDCAFYRCADLITIQLPSGVESIGSYAFSKCSAMTTISIPDGVTGIGSYAFAECSSLVSLAIPHGVTSIEEYTFSQCTNMYSIEIPNSVTSIGVYAFSECSTLFSIDIPDGVTIISSWTFKNCTGLTRVSIPEGVTKIQSFAFYYCSGLAEFDFPSSLIYLGERACQGCSGLNSITCRSLNPPECFNSQSYVFSGVSRATLLYVPAASISKYQSAYVWKEFYNIFPISE